jgi:hypothetical protein
LDIELAPFFLRHLISQKNLNYSCFDDLMFLDRDLYNNLNFVKVNQPNKLSISFHRLCFLPALWWWCLILRSNLFNRWRCSWRNDDVWYNSMWKTY